MGHACSRPQVFCFGRHIIVGAARHNISSGIELRQVLQSISPVVLESRDILESRDFRENHRPTRYFASELSVSYMYSRLGTRPPMSLRGIHARLMGHDFNLLVGTNWTPA